MGEQLDEIDIGALVSPGSSSDGASVSAVVREANMPPSSTEGEQRIGGHAFGHAGPAEDRIGRNHHGR